MRLIVLYDIIKIVLSSIIYLSIFGIQLHRTFNAVSHHTMSTFLRLLILDEDQNFCLGPLLSKILALIVLKIKHTFEITIVFWNMHILKWPPSTYDHFIYLTRKKVSFDVSNFDPSIGQKNSITIHDNPSILYLAIQGGYYFCWRRFNGWADKLKRVNSTKKNRRRCAFK